MSAQAYHLTKKDLELFTALNFSRKREQICFFLESGTNKVKEDGQENIWHVWSQNKGNEAGAWTKTEAFGGTVGNGYADV